MNSKTEFDSVFFPFLQSDDDLFLNDTDEDIDLDSEDSGPVVTKSRAKIKLPFLSKLKGKSRGNKKVFFLSIFLRYLTL